MEESNEVVEFTARDREMLTEIHSAITEVAKMAESVGPMVEGLMGGGSKPSGPMGLIMKSLVR